MKTIEFDIQDLLPIGITIGVLGVALSYMASMQSDVRGNPTFAAGCHNSTGGTAGTAVAGNCGFGYNVSTYSLQGSGKLASNIPLIVGAVVIAVVIGILLRYFVFGNRQ